MVFHRKPDPVPALDKSVPSLRRLGTGVEKQHLQPVPADGAPQSVIGSDLSIEGETITIRCKGSLKVLGKIQADVHSKALEVGREAVIEGSIAAESVAVFGRVSGAILGANVVLHSGAEVEGDIHSHLLSIEQGAIFDGRSRRVADPAEVAPKLEREDAGALANGAAPQAPFDMHRAELRQSAQPFIMPAHMGR